MKHKNYKFFHSLQRIKIPENFLQILNRSEKTHFTSSIDFINSDRTSKFSRYHTMTKEAYSEQCAQKLRYISLIGSRKMCIWPNKFLRMKFHREIGWDGLTIPQTQSTDIKLKRFILLRSLSSLHCPLKGPDEMVCFKRRMNSLVTVWLQSVIIELKW